MAARTGALLVVAALLVAGCGGSGKKPAAAVSPAPGAQLAAAPASQDSSPPSYTPSGQIVAKSDFRTDTNGFGFPNYGPGRQDMTPAQMVDLFGAKVCASGSSAADCVLTSPAEAWMTSMNEKMDKGHCFGFSALSLQMFQKIVNPLDFGAPTPFALLLDDNVALQERIAESWVLQTLAPVQNGEIGGTPAQVLDALTSALPNARETYTIAIFKRDLSVGHAVTPYAVEDKGGGKAAVLIYDNNFPGITRAIDFDRNADTWSYEAASNPSVASSLYEGDAQTKTTFIAPTTPGVGLQPCPFCPAAGKLPAARGRGRPPVLRPGSYEEITVAGDSVNHGHLVMTDSAGHRTGFVNGKVVNEIPGAQVVPLMLTQNWAEAPEPLYRIPRGVAYTVAIDGGALKAADAESLSLIGPGYAATVGNLILKPGQRDQLQLTGAGTSLTYRTGAGQTQRPHLQIGLDRAGRDYSFTVTTPAIPGGSALTAVAQPATGQLRLDAAGVKAAGTYNLAVTQVRRSGARTARGTAAQVPAGGSTRLRFAR
ncbi:MAG: hypothetical protein M3155_03680 [Actinomycetota bacterium]|nr:hypothetical protein [Actinomycetota bacterium]